jgi:metallo-beta-lactamase family protein
LKYKGEMCYNREKYKTNIMKIHFSGAAGEVTGSKHLVEINGQKILLDCGLFQGRRKEADRKNRNFPFNPKDVDVMVLSHSHLDHCGNLPTLVKNGYQGRIFCTKPTSDIVPVMLMDSAFIQEMDAKFVKKYIKNPAIPAEPLYRQEDIPPVTAKLTGLDYYDPTEILPGIFLKFYDAGHILGSAVVEITFTEDGKEKILVFTGDLGRNDKNLLHNPKAPPKADYLITESTYGNRTHDDSSEMRGQLAKIVNDTIAEGGKIIIPSFSLQRTQEVVYDLHLLERDKDIPPIPVFVDSPLAIKVTEVYKKHRKLFNNKSYEDFFNHGEKPLEYKNITFTPNVEDSKKLKDLSGPAIILSASGMCEGGRIRHHLKNEIWKQENTILFVGYQAQHTLGRRILERRPSIKIFDKHYRVKAHIKKVNGYSGHADRDELLTFIDQIDGIKNIFVVHGESSQSAEFAKILRKQKERKWTIEIPEPGDIIDPDEIYWDGE